MRLLPLLATAFLAFSLNATAESKFTDVPFRFVDGFILLNGKICQGQSAVFLLDSGAGASVLGLEAVRRLDLPLGKEQQVLGVGMTAAAYELSAVSASVGGLTLGEIPLAMDLRNAAELCSEPIDGILGIEFFAKRVVQIDFRKSVLRVGDKVPQGAGVRLTMTPANGVFLIPVSVNGSHPRLVRLDTGCNDALHWVAPRISARKMPKEVSIGFFTNDNDRALCDVQFAGKRISHVETALHGEALFPGEAGIAGTAILSQFLVTVDAGHRSAYFLPADPE